MRYLRESMRKGGDRVAEILGTEVMANLADDDDGSGSGGGGGARLRDCGFANVLLPLSISSPDQSRSASPDGGNASAATKGDIAPQEEGQVVGYMQKTFVDEFATFIAVYGYKGRLWTRLSGQVYLDMSDWEWCGTVLAEVCARVREGRFRAKRGEGEGRFRANRGEEEEEEEEEGNDGIKNIPEEFKGLRVEEEIQ